MTPWGAKMRERPSIGNRPTHTLRQRGFVKKLAKKSALLVLLPALAGAVGASVHFIHEQAARAADCGSIGCG
jgi:hypothetical protein